MVAQALPPATAAIKGKKREMPHCRHLPVEKSVLYLLYTGHLRSYLRMIMTFLISSIPGATTRMK